MITDKYRVQKTVDKKQSGDICLDITTKDFREIKYIFSAAEQTISGEKVYQSIQVFAFPKKESLYFAFSHNPAMPTSTVDGWDLYDDVTEYKRMGLNFDSSDCPFKLYNGNKDWSMTGTYPLRIVLPKIMTRDEIDECSKFRTKERFPALTYFYKANGTSLWRSSQPKVCLLNTSQ